MIKVKQFVFNPFAENTYLVWDTDSREGLVVDPGMVSDREKETFERYISDNGISLKNIVNTHLHVDHCIGNDWVRTRFGARAAAAPEDAFLGQRVRQQAAMFGVPMGQAAEPVIDVPLHDGDTITCGTIEFKVLAVPGHSPGSIALYCPEGKFVIVGDALFEGAIGRTDLPGGDIQTLLNSIRTKLYTLPGDTRVLSGHEGHTTIAREMATNPYTR